MTAHGRNALIASAAGTRISLLRTDPFATAHTTGSSRSARTPLTCSAFSARSSPRTPAVFLAATLVITDTSSRIVAMSSSSSEQTGGHVPPDCTAAETQAGGLRS